MADTLLTSREREPRLDLQSHFLILAQQADHQRATAKLAAETVTHYRHLSEEAQREIDRLNARIRHLESEVDALRNAQNED